MARKKGYKKKWIKIKTKKNDQEGIRPGTGTIEKPKNVDNSIIRMDMLIAENGNHLDQAEIE